MGHVMNALFNLTSVATGQQIHLVGILTEAIHTPYLHDRFLAIENARYIFNNARHFREEFRLAPGGRIERRAAEVLERTVALLEGSARGGLFEAVAEGVVAGIRRPRDGGKGLDGVLEKGEGYLNPFYALCLKGGGEA